MKNPKERKYIFYENMPELKRMRSVVLSKANGICEKCGKPARLVHHRDGKRDDHSPGNLLALCWECHKAIHLEMRFFAISGLFFPASLLADAPRKILARIRADAPRYRQMIRRRSLVNYGRSNGRGKASA